mmetsp:Transcript_13708/g.15905  ORF Transcript_13708/g.15905 Transcript_13708/m.15905 type:complete len:94 (+) Transcript_13708:210-491(+)
MSTSRALPRKSLLKNREVLLIAGLRNNQLKRNRLSKYTISFNKENKCTNPQRHELIKAPLPNVFHRESLMPKIHENTSAAKLGVLIKKAPISR